MVDTPTFKSISELMAYIQKSVTESLQNEVGDVSKETLIEHAQNDVLDQYSPKQYERRSSGGIDDAINTKADLIDKNTLSVRNETPPSPALFDDSREDKSELTRLSRWISEGIYNPFGVDDGLWNAPKPFVKNARDDLERSKKHIYALKKGLKARGIDTK